MTGRTTTANGITIAYDEFGDRSNPTLLLIMGLGTQMITWREEFCEDLASRGYHVVRFDNRDVGLSQKFHGQRPPNIFWVLIASLLGFRVSVPYTLEDMSRDAVGLLDSLGLDAAHVVGVSMGGMIAQLMAANYPERCLTLASLMSSSGRRGLPQAKSRVSRRLISRPKNADRDQLIAHAIETFRIIGSPDYQQSDEDLERKILEALDRSNYAQGHSRHLAASVANGSRVDALKKISAPTLVLHGEDDPLVPVAHGIDTARWIPGAQLEVIQGWGHDLPRQLWPQFVELIDENARRNYGKRT